MATHIIRVRGCVGIDGDGQKVMTSMKFRIADGKDYEPTLNGNTARSHAMATIAYNLREVLRTAWANKWTNFCPTIVEGYPNLSAQADDTDTNYLQNGETLHTIGFKDEPTGAYMTVFSRHRLCRVRFDDSTNALNSFTTTLQEFCDDVNNNIRIPQRVTGQQNPSWIEVGDITFS